MLHQDNQTVFDGAVKVGVALVELAVLENWSLAVIYRQRHRFSEGEHQNAGIKYRLLETVAELEGLPSSGMFDNIEQLAIHFAYDEPGLTAIIVGARNKRSHHPSCRSGENASVRVKRRTAQAKSGAKH